MSIEEHTWRLAAKKVANEASGKELNELNELLRLHPDIKENIILLFDWWDNEPVQAGNPLLFKKVLGRIKDNNPEANASVVSSND